MSKLLLWRSYIATIKNSLGSKQYRQMFIDVKGKPLDVLQNGRLSCAYFVSSLLHQFGLIDRPHATVHNTLIAMERAGWKKTKKSTQGCILVWEEKLFSDGPHLHMGFLIRNKQAISHSAYTRVPVEHHWTFGTRRGQPRRRIVSMYVHKNLKGRTKRSSI